jgi:hypothetical protein
MEGGAKNLSRLVKEIQTTNDCRLKHFDEAKKVSSNLGFDPELITGSRNRKKKRFFEDTGKQTTVLLLNPQIIVSRYKCPSRPWICFYQSEGV